MTAFSGSVPGSVSTMNGTYVLPSFERIVSLRHWNVGTCCPLVMPFSFLEGSTV
jgi:hypothetical protein